MEGFFLQAYLYVMAGIFRNLDQSDVRLTPFRAYKRFSGVDAFVTYSATLDVNAEDLGNNPLVPVSGSDFTTNYKLKNSVWHSIDSQFYRFYYDNAKASFGQINHTRHPRLLHRDAHVISIPQSNFGEGIEPLTVEVDIAHMGTLLVDDLYGNLVWQSGSRYIAGTAGMPVESLVFSLKAAKYSKQFGEVLSNTFDYDYDKYPAVVQLNNVEVGYPIAGKHTVLKLNNTAYATSSIVIQPKGDKINDLLNFQNKDFAITLAFTTGSNGTSSILLEKKAREEIIKIDENGNTYKQLIYRYPYRLTHLSGSNKIQFEKSDGYTTLVATSSFAYRNQAALTLMRSGSVYTIAQAFAGALTTSSFTDTLFSSERYCTNTCNIFVGSDESGNSGSIKNIEDVAFYATAFNPSESLNLATYYNNPYATMGLVARKQGLIIINDPQYVDYLNNGNMNVDNVSYRGTTTIYENEVSCTISPGEFGFSSNPTLHYYNSVRNQYELQDFATGSDFRPYVSRVGLYNDSNDLLVIGTLSHPIQPPQNVDTTFIIRYDM
ncbi:hypothetical protein UFOVP450_158 [uncultured Caudovirales phage]|uniref:Uncharacterized protein n=1 Tax=uncultured Caudovirales phage TaxID=2100421 RepID=A0A6J5MCJ5_9CAUD|nr:hypothetical protein UFOVP450_158 [uncultured Caudovirales phage]